MSKKHVFCIEARVMKEIVSMVRIRAAVFLSVLLVVLFSVSSFAQVVGVDPNNPDTLFIDSVIAYNTAGTGVVPVSFYNDEVLSGIEVTLIHNSTYVVIDSFSFLDGRLETASFKDMIINDDSTIVIIYACESIPPGNGLLGNIHFSYQSGIPPQLVAIDTTTLIEGQIEHSTFFTDLYLITFIPQFEKGWLDIQEAPFALDSIWLNNVSGEAGEPVAIEVNFFNQLDVNDIIVALDYGSSFLQYDSVSFQETREMPPYINSLPVQNQGSSHELRLQLTFDNENPLESGSGTIARLFFTIDPDAVETLIVVDTTTFAGFAHTSVTRTPAAGGDTFVPLFTAGSVEIKVSTDVTDVTPDGTLPASFELAQNYPNPFNPTTQIRFSLPQASNVRLDIFNLLGRRVCRLIDQHLCAGVHQVTFNGRSEKGRSLASGIYFYRISAGEYTEVRKMVLLK